MLAAARVMYSELAMVKTKIRDLSVQVRLYWMDIQPVCASVCVSKKL